MAEKKIGSRTYRAEKMPATEATRNLIVLTKIVGPGMAALTKALSQAEEKRDMAALEAVAAILMNSNADDLTAFVVEMAEKAQVKENGGSYESVIFDLHMSDLVEAFQVVAFVLQVNYASFFGGKLGGLISRASKEAA